MTYRIDQGWLCPARDQVGIAQRLATYWHVEQALPHVRHRHVVVQAGGNLGQWPALLSQDFEQVYTFEPDPINFACLAFNTRLATNVHRFQAGLWSHPTYTSWEVNEVNCEGSHVAEKGGTHRVQLVAGDDVVQPDLPVGLIALDVEGTEELAFQGLIDTVSRYRPVILWEAWHERAGCTMEGMRARLRAMDYRYVSTASHDEIWVPK